MDGWRVSLVLVLGLLSPPLSASTDNGPAWADHSVVSGPRQVTLPLYRVGATGSKLYVETKLSDGKPRFLLLDTGAAVSVIHREVADELGLEVKALPRRIYGLAGSVPWHQAKLPEVRLGRLHVGPLAVAVGVQGTPTQAGGVPVAGILGNDVLQHFQVVVDYSTATLTLAAPDTLDPPAGATSMDFDGQHLRTGVTLQVGEGSSARPERVLLELDTGADGVLLFGESVGSFADSATEGLEPIYGIGAVDDLPSSNFLRSTRRLPIAATEFAGVVVEREIRARWLDGLGGSPLSGGGTGGLLGHDVFDGNRLFLDYHAARVGMELSDTEPRVRDVRDRALQLSRRGRLALGSVDRARILAGLDRLDQAATFLERSRRRDADDHEATVILAAIWRIEGHPTEALGLTRTLPLDALVAHRELVSTVNGLWLAGEREESSAMARAAVDALPDAAHAWLALSDVLRAEGELAEARLALREVNRLAENPDGHLLRRAWIAQEEGDHFAAITHLRRLMDLYPHGGLTWWVYAMEAEGTAQEAQVWHDLERAASRLHPEDRPLDFLAAAHVVLGDAEGARRHALEGLARDCHRSTTAEGVANCEAWYRAMQRNELDEARARIGEAVAAEPDRTDFLDTQAMVYEASGDRARALRAAERAARLAPDDVYLRWQLERLARGEP